MAFGRMIRRYLWLYLCSCLRSPCWPATFQPGAQRRWIRWLPFERFEMLSDLVFSLRSLFRRNTVEAELDDELRFHFEQSRASIGSEFAVICPVLSARLQVSACRSLLQVFIRY